MRAAVIFGLGCSPKKLRAFQVDETIDWRIGLPAATDEADIVLVFGGDGTIHRHLSQLVKLKLPVLVVPTGSGNDFARAIGMRSERDSRRAWRRFCLSRDNIRTIDLGVVQGPDLETAKYFCSVAGVGLDAEVSRRANALPRWLRGHGGYVMALAPAIFRFAPFPIKISTAEEAGAWTARSDRPTMLAAFANTSIYGGGMKIAPGAQMDDGLLDVCILAGLDPFKLACLFPTVYFGRHIGIREVDYFQAAQVRIEPESRLELYADGEYVCQTPADISIEAGALRVVIAA